MQIKLILAIAFLPLCSFAQNNTKLWYKHPAKVWTEALPLGNGRLGAMVFGGIDKEVIQLNEGTLWSGGPVKTNVNSDAYENLKLARQALFNEEYLKAAGYTRKMQGGYSGNNLKISNHRLITGN